MPFPAPHAAPPSAPAPTQVRTNAAAGVALVTAVLGAATLAGAALGVWRAQGPGAAVVVALQALIVWTLPFLAAAGALAGVFVRPKRLRGSVRRRRLVAFRRRLNRRPWLVPAVLAPALLILAFAVVTLDGDRWIVHAAFVVGVVAAARFIAGRARTCDGGSLTAAAALGFAVGYFALS